jgi:SHS2 domain-containing protein
LAKGFADAEKIRGRYKLLDHTADIGIRVEAESLEELFALAACAMFDLMVDLSQVKPTKTAKISLKDDSLEDLFITWLNELIFRSDASGVFFSRFEVYSVTDGSLEASVKGEPYNEKVHSTQEVVKAATYHLLEVARSNGGWIAQVIFDV